MIYAHFPHKAWISINHTPTEVQQPTIAHVSRQVRREALAVFYSRNHFVLDLRGWKDAAYPKLWTPVDIFESWIYAIGDANAEYLRSLMIFAYVAPLAKPIQRPRRLSGFHFCWTNSLTLFSFFFFGNTADSHSSA